MERFFSLWAFPAENEGQTRREAQPHNKEEVGIHLPVS